MNRIGAISESRRQEGFTLIELMIVVALISALTTLLLPAVNQVLLPAVQKFQKQEAAIGALRTFTSAKALYREVEAELAEVADQAKPDSTQSLTWRLVVGAANADPAAGGLDQDALQSLYNNLLARDASITDLIAQTDALLQEKSLSPEGQGLLLETRAGLAQALDGVRKMKAVIESRATAGPAAR
jgi:prepilin-type N-terminal cleavage/methylation domain-containing protein